MNNSDDDRGIQVLLVEDDRRVREHIRELVENLNGSSEVDVTLTMECVASVRECLDHLVDFFVDVILLDLSLPDVHGIGAISQVAQSVPHVPIIVLTNISGWASMVQCAEAGGRDFLVKKGLDADTFFRSVYYAYERKQVEDRLRQSQAVYQSLVEHLPVGIFRKDTNGRYEFVNQAFCDALGYDEKQIKRRGDGDLFIDQDAETLHAEETEILQSRKTTEVERTLRTARGKEFDAQLIKIPLFDAEEEEVCGIQGVLSDITERKRSEEQRLMAERFAGMEALAGDIAHHVNNRLAPVMLNASIIESKSTDPELVKASQKIGRAASKAGQIVRHLLALAMQTDGNMRPVEMDLTLGDLGRYVKDHSSGGCRVDVRLAPDLKGVNGDFSRLKELLEQLCRNACESMENKGAISVSARNTTHDLCVGDETANPSSVDAVSIKIKDTGPGIPPEIRNRIFDPYFTTKNAEEHEGMGLAQCMVIARNHQGVIRLDPEPDKGTCIELILPAISMASSANSNMAEGQIDLVKGKTILLVDDEEPILEAAQIIFEGNGFNVMTASDGAQAIAKFSEHSAEISVVLTDLMMPYMDGAMLSKAIRDISATVPIFIATGLDSKENLDKLEGLGICEVIPKPFAPKDLVRKICAELTAA
jgi:two-component system cell cycle sensor histidine kinase/response regulator CckA